MATSKASAKPEKAPKYPAKIAAKVETFGEFCFCPTPRLDANNVCRKCGVRWAS